MGGRRFVERDALASVVRAAFGGGRRLTGVARLSGGSKKGVYRLTLDDGEPTAVLYVWDAEEDYWPVARDRAGEDRAGPFAHASGIDLFEASHARLDALGVRTPRVHLIDGSRTLHPADVAVVEDVRGGTLEALLHRDPGAGQRTLLSLGAALGVMHRHRGQRIGKLVARDRDDAPPDRSCEQVVLDRALGHLAAAASRVERIAAVREQLEETTRELASAVRPRTRYGLVHGELGPDHVLLDERGEPVIIDIEGAMFFDVEWEHAFLQLRFHEHYRWLRANDLDDRRLRFYSLAMRLSLVAGPLELLDGDYPDRELMMRIVEHNIDRTLSFLG